MTFTTKVTERDKKLLVLLAVVVIVVGSLWFIAKPAFEERGDILLDIAEVKMQKSAADYKVSRISELQTELSELNEKIDGKSGKYEKPLTSGEVDKLLTGIALDFANTGLSGEDLREMKITNTGKYLNMSEYSGKEPTELYGIYSAEVVFKLYETRDKLDKFIDRLCTKEEYSAIRVSAFSWSDTDENGFCTLTLTLSVYMVGQAQGAIDG